MSIFDRAIFLFATGVLLLLTFPAHLVRTIRRRP